MRLVLLTACHAISSACADTQVMLSCKEYICIRCCMMVVHAYMPGIACYVVHDLCKGLLMSHSKLDCTYCAGCNSKRGMSLAAYPSLLYACMTLEIELRASHFEALMTAMPTLGEALTTASSAAQHQQVCSVRLLRSQDKMSVCSLD